jgi:hypothetical protein
MTDKIFEIKISSIANMSDGARKDVIKKVSQKSSDFQKNFMGFAKITYVTASPKHIQSIEPIEGTIVDYFRASQKEGVNIPTF